jgi:methyl-accepting chemotaxis protein
MCVPVLGPALSGLYSVVNLAFGASNKAKQKEVNASWQKKFAALTTDFKAFAAAAQEKAAAEEYPAAQQLAASGVPLDDESDAAMAALPGVFALATKNGRPVDPENDPVEPATTAVPLGYDALGNLYIAEAPRRVLWYLGPAGLSDDDLYAGLAGSWGRFMTKVKNTIKKVTSPILKAPIFEKVLKPVIKKISHVASKVVAEVIVRPIRIVGRAAADVASVGFRVVGDKKRAAKLRKVGRDFDHQGKRFTDKFAKTIESPKQMKEALKKGSEYLTGYAAVRALDEQMEKLYNKTKAQLDQERATITATTSDPAYRQELRLQLARSIRNPEAQIAAASEVAAKDDAMVKAMLEGTLPIPGAVYADGTPVEPLPASEAVTLDSREVPPSAAPALFPTNLLAAGFSPAFAGQVARVESAAAASVTPSRIPVALVVGGILATALAAGFIIRSNR